MTPAAPAQDVRITGVDSPIEIHASWSVMTDLPDVALAELEIAKTREAGVRFLAALECAKVELRAFRVHFRAMETLLDEETK